MRRHAFCRRGSGPRVSAVSAMTNENDDRETLPPPSSGVDAYSAPTVVTETPEHLLEAIKAARAASTSTSQARPRATAELSSEQPTPPVSLPLPSEPRSAPSFTAAPAEALPAALLERPRSALTGRQKVIVAALVLLAGALVVAIAWIAVRP